MTTEVIKVSAHSTRAELERAITIEKARHDRMPAHWVARRDGVMADIEQYVDWWLAAGAGS